MLPRLVLLLALLSPIATQAKRDPAETAYQEARRSYYALKDDAARRKLRHDALHRALVVLVGAVDVEEFRAGPLRRPRRVLHADVALPEVEAERT